MCRPPPLSISAILPIYLYHSSFQTSRPGWPAPSDAPNPEADDEAYGTAAHGFSALDLREVDQANAAREFLEGYPQDMIAKQGGVDVT
jgi:hypothetical protein